MLHTVNKSPFEKTSLDTCLRLVRTGAVILLIEDAVYAATKNTVIEAKIKRALTQNRIYVLGPDLDARGLQDSEIIDGIEVVDYGGFVDLAGEHRNVQSWF